MRSGYATADAALRREDPAYGYVTGRLRMLEGNLLTRERLEDTLNSGRAASWNLLLNDLAYPEERNLMARIEAGRREADRLLLELDPDRGPSTVFLLEQAYHNLKVILKLVVPRRPEDSTLPVAGAAPSGAATEPDEDTSDRDARIFFDLALPRPDFARARVIELLAAEPEPVSPRRPDETLSSAFATRPDAPDLDVKWERLWNAVGADYPVLMEELVAAQPRRTGFRGKKGFGGKGGLPGRLTSATTAPKFVVPDRETGWSPWMDMAVSFAARKYLATREVGQIDIVLDQFYYVQLNLLACALGQEFMAYWARLVTDIANLNILLRHRTAETEPVLAEQTLLPTGSLSLSELRRALTGTAAAGEEDPFAVESAEEDDSESMAATTAISATTAEAEHTPIPPERYAEIFRDSPAVELTGLVEDYLSGREGRRRFARRADNLRMRLSKIGRDIVVGPQVLAGYWLARQTEAQNLRLALALQGDGAESEIELIRALLRDLYTDD